ncbi:uncharacterized protein GJ701_013163 isoform 1-T3 [Geothlypis trichas]
MAATLEPRHIWSGVSLLRNRGQLQPEPAEPSAALKGSPPASPSLLPGFVGGISPLQYSSHRLGNTTEGFDNLSSDAQGDRNKVERHLPKCRELTPGSN